MHPRSAPNARFDPPGDRPTRGARRRPRDLVDVRCHSKGRLTRLKSAGYVVCSMGRASGFAKAERHPLFTTRVGELTLAVRCDPTLAEGARSLLGVVASFARRGHGLMGGVSLQFGWSRVTLVEQGASLRLHEPDFARGEGIRADLTASLRVARGQATIARATGLAPTVATCFQHVTVVGACLGERHLTMRRRDAASPDDSGWVLERSGLCATSSAAARAEADPPTVVPSGRLVTIRAALLDVFSLPVGHEVDFEGDTVIALRASDPGALGQVGVGAA